jgi:uncharacterized membrane protein
MDRSMSPEITSPSPALPASWVLIATGLLALTGLGISTYLTIAHFEGTQTLACSSNGIINCAKVTTSAQSRFVGIPVAILGLGYYFAAIAIYSPWAWRSAHRTVHLARVAFSILGIGFALWLISAELLIIKNICEWCTAVHLVTFSLFVITMTTAPRLLEELPA